jgi:hypothetical protein
MARRERHARARARCHGDISARRARDDAMMPRLIRSRGGATLLSAFAVMSCFCAEFMLCALLA